MARLQEVLCDGENYGGARPCHSEWVKALRDECAEFDVTFVFCGTGRLFVKDGRTYHLEGHLQSEQARKSGMSYEGRAIGLEADGRVGDARSRGPAVPSHVSRALPDVRHAAYLQRLQRVRKVRLARVRRAAGPLRWLCEMLGPVT